MTEAITSSALFNSFKVFREILTGITALSDLNDCWGYNRNYYEDFPNVKSGSGVDFPFVLVETESNQSSLTLKEKKQMFFTTTVSIYTDHFVEKEENNLNGYLNAIVYWFNNNKNTLRWTYSLWGTGDIAKDRDIEIISQKKVVVGTLVFNYHVTLDMVA